MFICGKIGLLFVMFSNILECLSELSSPRDQRRRSILPRITASQTLRQINPILYIFWKNGAGFEEQYKVHLSSYVRSDIYNLPNNGKETYVIIHGWMQFWPRYWMYWMKDELIDKGHNVILLRWTKGSKFPLYSQSAKNTEVVGNALANYISMMGRMYPRSVLGGVSFVGFSLGAHVAGFASSRLFYPIYTKIYGLDPAGYEFQGEAEEKRLSRDDAKEVYVIHTNAGTGTIVDPIRNTLGIKDAIGHWDFYVNGGTRQPGCFHSTQALSRLAQTQIAVARQKVDEVWEVNYRLYCDHHRAIFIFLSLIRNHPQCQMTAFACSSAKKWAEGKCFACDKTNCAKVGYGAKMNYVPYGSYYFNTVSMNNGNYNQSLCTHQYLVTLKSDKLLRGSIIVALQADHGKWIYANFLGSEESMTGNADYSVMLAMPYDVPVDISSIRISYERTARYMIRKGPGVWDIKHISVKNEEGILFSNDFQKNTVIRDRTTHQIRLRRINGISDNGINNIIKFLTNQ